MSTTVDNITITAMAVWLAVTVFWALRHKPSRYPLPLLILVVGSIPTGFAEPIWDLLVGVQWFSAHDSVITHTAFGRPIPLWMFFAYASWGGSMSYLTYVVAQKPRPVKNLWKLYGALVVVEFFAEWLILRFGLVGYFGAQPFRLSSVTSPFMWPFTIVASVMFVGLALDSFLSHTTGARRLLFLPAIPGLGMGFLVFAGWPEMLGVGMNLSTPGMTCLALVGLTITVATTQALFRMTERRKKAALPPETKTVEGTQYATKG
ncbi:hypothetical protein [Streptomyces sp. NPDC018045]|uniref:hypothetical protein n=1 Tax=Streptomyces sp. NPDC018045 TaxID=3365037 RepID=UPI0037AA0BC7